MKIKLGIFMCSILFGIGIALAIKSIEIKSYFGIVIWTCSCLYSFFMGLSVILKSIKEP